MTQLVGRILRQPHALRTGVADLDESYVFTHRAETAAVVKAIKAGLEADGLGDLIQDVSVSGAAAGVVTRRKVQRRDTFRQTDIALPQVLWIEQGQDARELDAESDLFPAIDWSACDVEALADDLPENAHAAASQIVKISTGEDGEFLTDAQTANRSEAQFDAAHAVRMLTDIVPNAYVARDLVGRVLKRLGARGFDADKVGGAVCLHYRRNAKMAGHLPRSGSGKAVWRAAGQRPNRISHSGR